MDFKDVPKGIIQIPDSEEEQRGWELKAKLETLRLHLQRSCRR